jgi:hypothetical protein
MTSANGLEMHGTCKIARLSYVAEAELPKRYLVNFRKLFLRRRPSVCDRSVPARLPDNERITWQSPQLDVDEPAKRVAK